MCIWFPIQVEKVQDGLVWFGLVWAGWVGLGLVQFGLVWSCEFHSASICTNF